MEGRSHIIPISWLRGGNMRKLRVAKVRKLITERPTLVRENESLPELALAITEDPKTRTLYVVDEAKKLIGLITLGDLIQAVFANLLEIDVLGFSACRRLSIKKASDVMSDVLVYAKDEEDIETVLRRMLDSKLAEIPVIDNDMKVIGEIDLLELLTIWVEKAMLEE